MVFRLFLFLLAYAAGITAGLAIPLVAFRLLAPDRYDAWKRRRLGRHNARLLEAASADTCSICMRLVDPKLDLYAHNEWQCRDCHDQIHKEIAP